MKTLNMITGMLLGVVITLGAIFATADKVLMVEDVSSHDYNTTVTLLVNDATNDGWKIPKIHDIGKVLKKHNADVGGVTIIEFCQPKHAAAVLKLEGGKSVSSMMPCRVSVYEHDGKVYVSRMNSDLISYLLPIHIGEKIRAASDEIEAIIADVI
jgi:uncharacterized protein (DUF302 family)